MNKNNLCYSLLCKYIKHHCVVSYLLVIVSVGLNFLLKTCYYLVVFTQLCFLGVFLLLLLLLFLFLFCFWGGGGSLAGQTLYRTQAGRRKHYADARAVKILLNVQNKKVYRV